MQISNLSSRVSATRRASQLEALGFVAEVHESTSSIAGPFFIIARRDPRDVARFAAVEG